MSVVLVKKGENVGNLEGRRAEGKQEKKVGAGGGCVGRIRNLAATTAQVACL